MKKTTNTIAAILLCTAMALTFASATQNKGAISKKGSTTVVNTTSIAKSVKGYGGTTPLKIYISSNKITKIETLANNEAPGFFARAKKTAIGIHRQRPENRSKDEGGRREWSHIFIGCTHRQYEKGTGILQFSQIDCRRNALCIRNLYGSAPYM